jgi:hypothetical protein
LSSALLYYPVLTLLFTHAHQSIRRKICLSFNLNLSAARDTISGDLQPFSESGGGDSQKVIDEKEVENEFLRAKINSAQESIHSFHGEQKLL